MKINKLIILLKQTFAIFSLNEFFENDAHNIISKKGLKQLQDKKQNETSI